jgi:hypothetical protein
MAKRKKSAKGKHDGPLVKKEYAKASDVRLRATPTVPHLKLLLLLFWQKKKKPSPTVPHFRLPLSQVEKKMTPHAYICA